MISFFSVALTRRSTRLTTTTSATATTRRFLNIGNIGNISCWWQQFGSALGAVFDTRASRVSRSSVNATLCKGPRRRRSTRTRRRSRRNGAANASPSRVELESVESQCFSTGSSPPHLSRLRTEIFLRVEGWGCALCSRRIVCRDVEIDGLHSIQVDDFSGQVRSLCRLLSSSRGSLFIIKSIQFLFFFEQNMSKIWFKGQFFGFLGQSLSKFWYLVQDFSIF